jgi:hypothetical protein
MPSARGWRSAVPFVLLWGALSALLLARSRSDAWVGDFWIYVATLAELAVHPLHPRNPLFGNGYAFAFLSPYTQALGLVSRVTGLRPADVLVGQGLVNVTLLSAALYAFVAAWLRRPRAAFYALLFLLFLWGRDPWRFSGFFHLDSLAYVMSYPSTFAAALALGTLAAFPRVVGSPRAWLALVVPLATLVWIVHPITGVFLWAGLFAFSLSAPRSRGHWLALVVAAAATFGLALAWPLVPMRELWFGQLARVHEGNDTMYSEPLARIAPALLGVPWLLVRLRRDRRDPLALLALALGALVVYGGVSGQWSYGRLVSHLVLVLQVALADAMVSAEDRLARVPRGRLLAGLVAPVAAGLLIAASWPAVRGVLAVSRPGQRDWLDFLRSHVGRYDVVLTDLDTCWYVPAFHGKVVAYPMQLPFVPDHAERVQAVKRFFEPEATRAERLAILERYGVAFVLLPRHHLADQPQVVAAVQELGTPIFVDPEYDLLRVR